VKLELTAKVDGFKSGLKTAQKATQDFASDVEKWRKKNEEHLDTVGSAAGKMGLSMAAGLAFTAKSAMDWESAWTGVLKTVDGTPEQLGRVEDGLRGLARELPSSHTEIAAVAEAAGQLGIQTDNVVGFTKVMIDLGESTNLGAEQAAMSLSRFMNIMGTSQNDVNRLGATLVGLGNNFATTESEIMEMSMRLAGAGKQAHLSEGQVMGLATAMSSVGIEAEAGGTAMSMILKKIGKAVDEGGDSLSLFASTSGMSAEQFRQSWGDDASGTLSRFVTGLSAAADGGESVNSILSELGIKGIRESDALLRLSAAGELVGKSMTQGAEEYDSGMALIEEANKRYATTESKIKMAWNSIKDAAIEAGGAILPVVADLADSVSDLATWFGNLPAPVHQALTLLGTVGATAGLGVAGLVAMSKKLGELRLAMEAIHGSGGRVTRTVEGLGKALTGITVVGAGLIIGKGVIEGINKAVRDGKPDVEEYFNLLATGGGKGLSEGLKFDQGDEARSGLRQFQAVTKEAQVAHRALERLGTMNDALLGRWWSENITLGDTRQEIDEALELEKALQGLARAFEMGEAAKGQEVFADFAKQMQLSDEQVGEMIQRVPELKAALTELATSEGIQIDPDDNLGLVDLALGRIKLSGSAAAGGLSETEQALADMGIAADGTVAELDKMLDSLLALSTGTLSVRAAERNFQESIDAVTESIKENGKSLDETTPKGRANQAALDAVASSGLDVARSMAEAKDAAGGYVHSQSEVQSSLQSTYDATYKAAQAFTGSKEEAKQLTRELLGIPKGVSVDTWMSTFAEETAQATKDAIEAIPGYKVVQIAVTEDGTAGSVQSRINEVTGKTEYVFVSDDGTVQTVQAAIASIDGKNVPVYVTDDGTVVGTQKDIDGIKGKNAVVNVTASGVSDVEGQLANLARPRSASITLKAKLTDVPTPKSMQTLMGVNRASGGSVFGPGTETSDSIPAMLSNSEHVWSAKEVRGAGGHGQVERLRAMARNGQLPAFKNGGAVGRAEKRVQELQRAYSRIDGKKQNRARKLAAKDQLDAAKAELKAAKAAEKRSKEAQKKAEEARKKAREKAERLSELRFDLRRDLKRGTITDQFTSGSGMSVVDRLFEQSNNKDLSRNQRGKLRSLGYKLESELLKLEKRSDKLTNSMEKARAKRDDLLSVRNSVASHLQGDFTLGGVIDDLNRNQFGKTNAASIAKHGKLTVQKYKDFEKKLQQLLKKGYSGAVIQEIAEMGVEEGSEAADILLKASVADRNTINSVYRDIEKYSRWSGDRVTDALSGGMYKGGLYAANGLVKGLQSQQKNVDNAFYKLGKDAEKSFKRSLGIKSPSRVMMQAGVHVGEGAELGILSKVGDVSRAAERLMTPPALMVPPSVEVRRYAAAQPTQSVQHHYHIDAKPGLAYEYAQDIADRTATRVGDKMAAYGIR